MDNNTTAPPATPIFDKAMLDKAYHHWFADTKLFPERNVSNVKEFYEYLLSLSKEEES